jgi:formate hydrogenlyase subunit 6/NADH:ubiquinone oxidoreductase subunit I
VTNAVAFRILESCTGCTACERRCPTDAITGKRGELFVIDPVLCVDCGACGVVCPVEAILDGAGVVQPLLRRSQRPYAFVDDVACTGCDLCTDHCPWDCLSLVPRSDDRSSHFKVIEVNERTCTGCRECVTACPYEAIFVFRKDQLPAWLGGAEDDTQRDGSRGPPERAG